MPSTVPSPFPNLPARDLTGRDVRLPDAFEGERNVVVVAFKRHQQTDVDSWVPWLDERARLDPGLRFYEVPTIGDVWTPARRFIDGGMAAAIGDPAVQRRTLTVYGDVRRLTDPFEIDGRDMIWLFAVDGSGRVRWRAAGRFDPELAEQLAAALDAMADEPDASWTAAAIVLRYLPVHLAHEGAMHGAAGSVEDVAQLGLGGVLPVFDDEEFPGDRAEPAARPEPVPGAR